MICQIARLLEGIIKTEPAGGRWVGDERPQNFTRQRKAAVSSKSAEQGAIRTLLLRVVCPDSASHQSV